VDFRGDYDLALVELKTKVTIKNSTLTPICLPKEQDVFFYAEQTATVAGWGKPIYKEAAGNRVLQKLDVPVLRNKLCEKLFKVNPNVTDRSITPRMICGGYLEGGRDSCVRTYRYAIKYLRASGYS
jgi:trypsin